MKDMKRFLFVLVAVVLSVDAMAFTTTVKSELVGNVAISSKNDAWQIDAKVVSKGEVEEITIEMKASQPTTPSPLKMEFTAPQ